MNTSAHPEAGSSASFGGVHWSEAVSDLLGPMNVTVQPNERRGRVQSRGIGDLVLADWDCPPLEGALSKAVDRRSENGTVMVLAGLDGEETLSFGGTDVSLRKGGLVLASGGRAGEGFSIPKGVRKRSLRLPRTALEAAGSGGDIPDCLALAHDRPFVRLVHDFMGAVWMRLPDMNASETEAARSALVTLLAAAVRAAGEEVTPHGSSSRVLREQLEQWITERLARDIIRVEDLALAHNVSTRTVYRTFALTGDTMTGVVRARRLAAVRDDLVRTDHTIAAIAHRWNYFDASHLGREFRRYFKLTPNEYRQKYAVRSMTGKLATVHPARTDFVESSA